MTDERTARVPLEIADPAGFARRLDGVCDLVILDHYLIGDGSPGGLRTRRTNSKIEWTEVTWNPVLGCSICSPGWHHCYAMVMACRLKGIAIAKIARGENPGRLRYYIEVIGDDGRWNGKLVLVPEALADPVRWKRSQMIFVNSMSDLFHENLPVEEVRKVCEAMAKADWHTYQVLTKRADRMRELLSGPLREYATLPHIWWGTSVENRRHGLPRIEELRKTPAAVRFLSIEPLLEDLGDIDLTSIHWVIVGGESGAGARPMEEAWVLSLRDQCRDAGVPFFFKQWGGRNKKAAGRLLDGRTWDEMPTPSRNPIASGCARVEHISPIELPPAECPWRKEGGPSIPSLQKALRKLLREYRKAALKW